MTSSSMMSSCSLGKPPAHCSTFLVVVLSLQKFSQIGRIGQEVNECINI